MARIGPSLKFIRNSVNGVHMSKNIGYHTRLDGNNTVKLTGGSFGGSFDIETVNRLVKSHFTVSVKNSGRLVFVDKTGREVSLYFTVDPQATEAGQVVLKEYRKLAAWREQQEDAKMARVNELIDGMSADELLKRLEG